MADPTDTASDGHAASNADLLSELVAHLRANRTQLRQEWARRIGEARLLTAPTQEGIFSEATSVYDNYVEVLETGSVEALQDYARNLSERIIPRGVATDEVLRIVLLLRDVLVRGIRTNRARVVVIDITGVPAIDSTVANHLVQTVDASRLMGASVIITGLSSAIAPTLVALGVDLSKVNAVGDLQGGIEEAERLLGYTVISGQAAVAKDEDRN